MSADFSYATLRAELAAVRDAGYASLRCVDYLEHKKSPRAAQVLVLRVDIDLSMAKTTMLLDIFAELGLKATFFVRLHAPEYNPFSFEGYRILKRIVTEGHELGYHAEIIDQATIWQEDGGACLRRDLAVLSAMAGVPILGAACHGGLTGNNNLDFFKENDHRSFGLLYEGYDRTPEFNLFHESRYVSDSEWTRWKAYDQGVRMEGDVRPPSGHLPDRPPVLHLLIHPDTYYHSHFYERER
ncbi:MAG TPA: hypothetical protein PLR99_08755 [Polyangiaceae bacterium]|jgi:hypothetical protein|nr:hypothetical protein [Polyangiaceae bacterium]